MELGVKIKQARLEMGLSQRQLCGDTVTRNMLSQIENGSARPSMDTLRYFGERLGKPISWFLEEETVTSPNQQIMDKARRAFAQGDHAGVTRALEAYRSPDALFDGERWLLASLSLMEQAKQAMTEDKDVYARSLLEAAGQAGARTPYFTAAMHREWVLLMGSVGTEQASRLVSQLPQDDRELLLRARGALETGDHALCTACLDAAGKRDETWYYLRGQAAMGQKDYTLAREHFHRAEERFPRQCAQFLEICYRELEDYKMAYFYACKQR